MNKLKLCFIAALMVIGLSPILARDTKILNEGWRYQRGDFPEASNAQFDDSDWQTRSVPHDWAYEEGYAQDAPQIDRGGYGAGGIAWYRQYVNYTADELKGKAHTITFDGVYMNSEVWVNGEYLGKRPYGYIPFYYDVTNVLKEGENIISVRVDNSLAKSARWYHGCGIYGDVNIISSAPQHFERWSLYVTTPSVSDQMSEVAITANIVDGDSKSSVRYTIRDAEGNKVAESKLLKGDFTTTLNIENPSRWDLDNPYLYTLEAELINGRKVIDSETTRFGVRTLEWSAETGFWLNGRNQKIYGVCEHLEGGPVGAASNRKLIEWKVRLLKDMGCNAIRASHNPQVPYFYEICDELGMMVVDESFDGWGRKAVEDYGEQAFEEWWERDLRTMVRRSRNHASVILYSVGNETHGEVATDLVRVANEEDNTRLVTSGSGESSKMQVFGANGGSENQAFIENFKIKDVAFIGTETPHTWQVRGYYRTQTWYRDGYPMRNQTPYYVPDLAKEEIFGYDWTAPENKANAKQFFNSSYDNATVRITARKNIEVARDMPWYAGNFRWTGFDYRGEAGFVHGGWPFRAFMGGALDLAGFEKDLFYLYQSMWRTDIDMVHILPHWTHPDMKLGTEIPVWVYTTGDEVELFLNGESLGREKKGLAWDEMQCDWMVPWTPGTIEAVSYRNGKEICRTSHTTAAAPAAFTLESDIKELNPGPEEVALVTLRMTDDKGVFHPFGENRVYFNFTGDAYALSLENGNPVDVECNYKAESKCPFFGLLRAFVQTTSTDDITITAGAICGDKSQKQSNEVSINIEQIALRGPLKSGKIEIFYTTDGSKATKSSKRYTTPFEVAANTTVNAVVYLDGKQIFDMTEGFGDGSGIYWGVPGDKGLIIDGMLAVDAKCENTDLLINRESRLVYIKEGGSVEWYQENDGASHTTKLNIHYSHRPHISDDGVRSNVSSSLELWVNGVKIDDISFTGGFNSKLDKVEIDITLKPGANEIVLKNTEGISPDLYYINL